VLGAAVFFLSTQIESANDKEKVLNFRHGSNYNELTRAPAFFIPAFRRSILNEPLSKEISVRTPPF
jgi:hypothetical protein